MTKRDRAKLQRMINRTVKHGAVYHVAQAELNEWCLEHYGYEPSDIDADTIIDSIFGGCGPPSGMTADAFDEAMQQQ